MNKHIYIENPINLIKNRFDIKIKYLYARALEFDLDTDLYRFIYEHHLEKWNGFKEQDEKVKDLYVKQSFHDFDKSFKEILFLIKTKGFDSSISTVPTVNNYPINGAHRIAACLLYNKSVYCEEVKINSIEFYNEDYFEEKGISKNLIAFINKTFAKVISTEANQHVTSVI